MLTMGRELNVCLKEISILTGEPFLGILVGHQCMNDCLHHDK